MDTIDRKQIGKNHADLEGREAIEKITELVEDAQTCFFCTAAATDGSRASRPMSVQRVDEDGNLWFLSANDSHKNLDLALDPSVDLYFQGSAHSDFLHLKGTATISTDQEKIAELWEPVIQTWFSEGVGDSRVTVIKVEPSEGYYWDNKHEDAIGRVRMVLGAMIGKTHDESIEGKLSL